ncbi:hypothetical protein DTO271D3_7232 [Paecilomyces variotii]|nr:hypothetical protein DTO271D3_7232 [Paecilomyces variotii]
MSTKPSRIPDKNWEKHKQEIISLYLESGSTLERTMNCMFINHGFQASKNQYTRKLKDWRIAKNSKSSIWKYADRKLRSRAREGKKSNILLHGTLQSRSKVQKEIARHVTFTSTFENMEDASTPEGITVFTPPADNFALSHREVYIGNLPSVQFKEKVQTFIQHMLRETFPLHNNAGRARGAELYARHAIRVLDRIGKTWSQSYDLDCLRTIRHQISTLRKSPDILRGNALSYVRSDTADGNDQFFFHYVLPEALEHKEVYSNSVCDNSGIMPPISTVRRLINCFIIMLINNLLIHQPISSFFGGLTTEQLARVCSPTPPFLKILLRKLFLEAVYSGDTSLAGKIMEHGVHPDTFVWTPLCAAVRNDDLAMVELLCKAGARPQIAKPNGWNRVRTLMNRERTPVLRTLLACGADPERFIMDVEPGYPLLFAASMGNLEAVALLLRKGARVNVYLPKYYGTALQAATVCDDLELVKALIEAGADVNAPNGAEYELRGIVGPFYSCSLETPIQIAAKNDNSQIVQILLEHGASAIVYPYPPFGTTFFDSLDILRDTQLYEYHNNVSTAIQYAAENQNFGLVAQFLSVGVDPDSRTFTGYGDTALQISDKLGNEEIVSLLLMNGADVNAPPATFNGRTAIQACAESGSIPIALALLQQGASLNAPACYTGGMTALQAALSRGHRHMFEFLYANGADLHAPPALERGLTAVEAVADGGHTELLKYLIGLGANVNAPGSKYRGRTALQAAIRHRDLSMMAILIQNDADVNAPASSVCGTPLQEVSKADWPDGVKYLLQHGANIDDYYHLESSLSWAIRHRNRELVELFLENKTPIYIGYALWDAVRKDGVHEIIDLLLETDGILDIINGRSPFAQALYHLKEDDEITQLILDRILTLPKPLRDEHIRQAWDCLPLDHESENEGSRLFESFLETGADINWHHKEQKTTFLQRIMKYKWGTCIPISVLLDKGASVHILATSGAGTPLQEAILSDNMDTINLILERNPDVNAPPAEYFGATALQAAAMKGFIQVAITLLQRGADVAAPAAPIEGRTAIDGAAENGRWDMLQLLLNVYQGPEDLRAVCTSAAGYAQKEGHIEIAEWLRAYPGA